MRHRHLNHRSFTLVAIDDVIVNGRLDAWVRLRRELLRDEAVRAKVVKVCDARRADPSAQRHHFWRRYAQDTPSTR